MPFKSKLFAVLSIGWAAFIFSNSFKPGTSSSKMSSPIVEKICSWFEWLGIHLDVDATTVVVRKGAHFTEFLILGILITLCFLFMKKRLSYATGTILFLSLASGVTDEIIQSFIIGRSSMVQDVVIDFCGCLTAFLIISLIAKLRAKRRWRR